MHQCHSCNRLLLEENSPCPFCNARPTIPIPRSAAMLGLGAAAFVMAACYGGGPMMIPEKIVDNDNDGFIDYYEDCDDNNPDVNPAAEEICDGVDNNCNFDVDELIGLVYSAADEDGFGNPDTETEYYYHFDENCEDPQPEPPAGYTYNNEDCDDNNPSINPDAEEICDDQIDNDCNALFDLDDETCQ